MISTRAVNPSPQRRASSTPSSARCEGTGIGLSLARQRPPEVVLLDIRPPGMDGHQVLRHLCADPQLGGVAVVALSADAMPHDWQRGLAAGFDRCIAKPFDLRELLRVLEGLLRSRPAPLSPP